MCSSRESIYGQLPVVDTDRAAHSGWILGEVLREFASGVVEEPPEGQIDALGGLDALTRQGCDVERADVGLVELLNLRLG